MNRTLDNIKDIKVDRLFSFKVLLDKKLENIERVYRKYPLGNGKVLYVSDMLETPVVRYLLKTNDHGGCGGREVEIQTEDGPVKLLGPWSSNIETVQRVANIDLISCDVCYGKSFEESICYYGAVKVSYVQHFLMRRKKPFIIAKNNMTGSWDVFVSLGEASKILRSFF